MFVAVWAWVFGEHMGWFAAGTVMGGLIALSLIVFELIDDVTRRFANGVTGEEMTASELKRCRRSGWRAVHNIVLRSGDIDHVAIGPGGLVVIETKNPDAGWDWIRRNRIHEPWVRQVRVAALRAAALVRQHSGLELPVQPLLVVWAREFSEPLDAGDVRVIHGRDLPAFLRGLSPVVGAETVRLVQHALEEVAEHYDAVSHGWHPALARA